MQQPVDKATKAHALTVLIDPVRFGELSLLHRLSSFKLKSINHEWSKSGGRSGSLQIGLFLSLSYPNETLDDSL